MKSVREKIERPGVWPALESASGLESSTVIMTVEPLGEPRWDWRTVRKVLVVRLRSIGDTVLATPALRALRRFLPEAQIDILLEDWVAPLLDGFDDVTRVLAVERGSAPARARAAKNLRAEHYDVAFNLHGGTTATLLTRATGARHRVGYASYRYGRLHNHAAPSANEIWGKPQTHSAEQQLALLGWAGVPVSNRMPTRLAVTEEARASISEKLRTVGIDERTPFALIHPAAAFESKQWATASFARVAEELAARGLVTVAVAAPFESQTVEELMRDSSARIAAFTNLRLPEVTALASRARLFVGNDSGIAHISAAVATPTVVIFGSSNIAHWRPWTTAPSEIVREQLQCQPCPGYTCAVFDQPECIRRIKVEQVLNAIESVMEK